MRKENIPTELNLNQTYFEWQIYKFILENKVTVICKDTAQYRESGEGRYRVEQILNGYVHSSHARWTYSDARIEIGQLK